jgi:hypothetical protein
MDIDQLRKVRAAKDSTLDDVRSADADLAAELDALLRAYDAHELVRSLRLPDEIVAELDKIDFRDAKNDPVEMVRLKLEEMKVEKEDIDQTVHRAQSKKPSRRKTDPLGLHPAVAQQLSKLDVHEVATVAGLSSTASTALGERATAPSAINDTVLEGLIKGKKLTAAQASTVGFAATTFQLVDGDAAVARAITTGTFSKLGNKSPQSTEDLAILSASDWSTFLTDTKATLPAGTTPETFGSTLAARFAAVHPTAAFVGRLPAIDPQQIIQDITALAPLLAAHGQSIGLPVSTLGTGLSDAQLAPALDSHQRLTGLVNAYPGLQLTAVLDNPSLSAQEKAATLIRRTGYIGQVRSSVGQSDLLQMNLATDSPELAKLSLDKLGATSEEQQMVLKTVQAYQRVWSIAGEVEGSLALLQGGFDSAISIGKLNLDAFQMQSGIVTEKAQQYWEGARGSLADVTLSAGSIVDLIHGLYGKYVGNYSPSAEDYLKKLAGFQDLFGNLSLCNCQECQSILGPAAYFVDLMKFIDDNLRPQFATPGLPLDLKTRRPDLWTLILSCENTNTRIALLDIVDMVLENYIAQQLGYAGSLDDRNAIAALVYKSTLATHIDSFHQPFTLPLARIASYLTQFSNTRADVATALRATPTVQAQAELDLSASELSLITTPKTTLSDLGHLYTIAFTGTSTAVDQVDASVLDTAMGLRRSELGQIVATAFAAAGGAALSIVATKLSVDSVQNDVEWVRGLTVDALDRIHRFTRLARKTGWQIPDLDLVLQTLGDTSLAVAGLEAVAQVHAVMRQLSISVQDAAAMVGAIPQSPSGTSLFDRLFNPPSYVAPDGPFPQATTHFVHPAFRQNTPAPIDPNLPRLLSGLSVNLDDLASLARHLSAYLAQEIATGFDPDAANENDRYFVLSASNLTLLYRHARLARLLHLSVDDLFQMIGFLGIDHIAGLADLVALLDLDSWYTQTAYRVDDLAIATGQSPRDPTRYPVAADVAAEIVTAAATALTFTSTVFAVSLGTTEQGSSDVIAANPGVIEAAANSTFRLVAGVDLSTAPIVIPATTTVPTPPAGTRLVTVIEVQTALMPYVAAEVLVRSVGKAFNLSIDRVRALAALGSQSLITDAVVKAVRGDGPIAPLTALVGVLIPLNVIFKAAIWDAAALAFIAANPTLFGPDPLPSLVPDGQHPNAPFLTLSQVRALSVYTRLAERQTGTAPNETQVDPIDIQSLLTAFNPATPGFPPTSDAAMARVLDIPAGLVVGLRNVVPLATVAATALDEFDRAAQTTMALGVDGDTFAALISDDYDTLSHAADALTAVLRSRIADHTSLDAILEQLEQPVREAKRDALADYLINSIAPKIWSTRSDLYEYFLIDVDAGGCETTSLVVAATMSAQLYVYRALMSLEQDSRPPTDPQHFVLSVPTEAAAEWEWRKNYRVWQANREVFLWPENYMVPDLRDDKTPLFEEIEQELLQTSLTDQNVLDAYTKYLAEFDEVASLTIAGAYHDILSGAQQEANAVGGVTDVLHLFGCTADDPPKYYYRTCQNLISGKRRVNTGPIWSPWRKVTVQITGRRVAPVMHFGRLHVFWNDIKTRSRNQVNNGASDFVGYKHQMTLKYTTLRADGAWTAPQQLRLPPGAIPPGSSSDLLSDPYTSRFGPSRGEIIDSLVGPSSSGRIAIYDYQARAQRDPIDDYTLSGPNWDGIWPMSWNIGGQRGLEISYRNFVERRQVDLYGKTVYSLATPWTTDAQKPYPQLLCAKNGGDTKPLFWGVPDWMPYPATANANLVIDEVRMDIIEMDTGGPGTFKQYITPGLYTEQIATIPAPTRLLAVPGSVEDGILQVGNDVLLLQGSVSNNGRYLLTRIGTTLVDEIARRLFEDGVDAVLDIKTQLQLAEAGLPITLVGSKITDGSNKGTLDFKGAYGTYYREVFFYLPWLIANALNARGSYESCHNWYRYIFDPTANEVISVTGLTPTEAAHRVLDRVWRYREFRGLDLVTLRDILTDPTAIAMYKREPFNPWAIARRRISAFQKAIVMAMVSNLFDWADSLFRQFTMESVNEAMMLYIMASDILGPRPVELGDCGEGVTPDNYQTIGPLIDSSSEILIELETWIIGWRCWNLGLIASETKYVLESKAINHVVAQHPLTTIPAQQTLQAHSAAQVVAEVAPEAAAVDGRVMLAAEPARESLVVGFDWKETRTASWAPALANAAVKSKDPLGGRSSSYIANKGNFAGWVGRFGYSIITEMTPVFCVPANDTLLGYWDRLEDRLYKIHHCEDIDGNLRELALFAPPINPMQLVAMEAAGLSLDDVLGSSNGDLPPYRFTTLIERAKSFAATLSGFGSSLLSALEKKDAEHLNRLRLTQQMNILQMTTQIRQAEIDATASGLDALNSQLASAQYRSDFYDGLISEDRNPWEITQTAGIHTASGIKGVEATLGLLSAAFGFIPQVGSPFAMKYGGVELHAGTKSFADATGTLGAIAEAVGVSAGLEATFGRRSEGWKNLKQLATNEIDTLNKQITAMTIRLNIANDAYDLHEKGIDQLQELLDLADNRFTNLGLYTWLSGQLQLLYRSAFQNALAMAMLAQQAYRFERGDDTLPGLSLNYWDPAYAGLLAGEKLLIDLQSLERRYLETNYRTLEIDQPFALSQIDPQALLELRETGECTFTISEAYVDLFYPGHYKRRIKAARLTIPCITGPYVNVSATLTLEDSWIRPTATPGAPLVEVPPSRSVSVATSTAQNDGGVFELSFRDERYMPFEGLGVISRWHLRLPKTFRQWDYQTANDAVLWLSYASLQDGQLRDQVEANNAAIAGSIVNYFTNNPAKRLLSLRQDFSSSFLRLLRSPAGTPVTITLSERSMPLFVQGRPITITRGMLVLRTASGAPPVGFALSIDGTSVGATVKDPTLGDLPAGALPGGFSANLYGDHVFTIVSAGNLAPAAPPPGDTSSIDPALLLDMMVYLEYQFQ